MSTKYLNLGMTFDRNGDPAGEEIVQYDRLITDDHNALFSFLDADLSQLQGLIRDYLACLEEGRPGNYDTLLAIHKQLFSLHPYFKVYPTAVDVLLNQTFAAHLSSLDISDDEKVRAFRLLASTEYVPMPDYEEMNSGIDVFSLQIDLRRWVFVTLDDTNPAFAKMSTAQRNALYYLMYRDQFTPVLDTNLQYSIRPTNRMRRMMAAFDFSSKHESAALDLVDMTQHPEDEVPEGFQEILAAVDDVVEDCSTLVYAIADLRALLSLEIFDLAQTGLRIKRCKNCGRYFVIENDDEEYCLRIPAGEKKSCRELNTAQPASYYAVTIKIPANEGAAAIQAAYRKAYKTHYARIKAGTLTEEEFNRWKAIASKMKDTVAAGEMTLEAYEEWLKA